MNIHSSEDHTTDADWVVTALREDFPQYPAATIRAVVEQAYRDYQMGPIRGYIPLFVERKVRRLLGVDTTVRSSDPDVVDERRRAHRPVGDPGDR